MKSPWHYLLIAGRLLKRDSLSTLSILLSLTLGIGLHAAAITLFLSFCRSPVTGVEDPQNLVLITGGERLGGGGLLPISFPDYQDLVETSHRLSGIAAFQAIRPTLIVSEAGDAQPTGGEAVTSNLFTVLGIKPLLGRLLLPEDDKPGASGAVVLSYQMWVNRFGQDPRTIGRKILIGGQPCTVVGVLRSEFVGIDSLRRPQFWVSISAYDLMTSSSRLQNQRGNRTVLLLGRLARGSSVQQAEEEIRALSNQLVTSYPDDHDGRGVTLVELRNRVPASGGTALMQSASLLFLLSLIFLLLACSNAAVLLLVKALERGQEIATRLALGATRRTLLVQFLMESLFIALLGTASATLFELGFLKLLIILNPSFAQIFSEGLARGLQHLNLSGLLAFAVILACGAAPMLHAFGVERISSRGGLAMPSGLPPHARFVGRFLIGLQALLCTASLACAGFFALSFLRLNRIEPGIEQHKLLLVSLDIRKATNGRRIAEELLEGFQDSTHFRSAALAENTLLTGFRTWRDLSPTRHAPKEEKILVASDAVSESYFRTISLPVLKGRYFDREDYKPTSTAVIVNEALATHLRHDGMKALGRRFFIDNESEPVEIVGIVQNISFIRADSSVPILYRPLSDDNASRLALLVRFSGSLPQAVSRLRSILDRFGAAFSVAEVQTVSDVIDRSLWLPRSAAVLLSFIALLSLLLTAIGIYAVLSYFTRLRRREILIRVALGASVVSLAKNLLTKDIIWSLAGSLFGLVVAALVHRYTESLLYRPSDGKLVIMTMASILVLAIAMTAGLMPVTEVAGSSLSDGLR